MVKALSLLAIVPAATAFIAPAGPKMARGRSMQMNFGYEEGGLPAGGVTFFPDSAQKWVSIVSRSGGERGVEAWIICWIFRPDPTWMLVS
jgi:hypothetical protein